MYRAVPPRPPLREDGAERHRRSGDVDCDLNGLDGRAVVDVHDAAAVGDAGDRHLRAILRERDGRLRRVGREDRERAGRVRDRHVDRRVADGQASGTMLNVTGQS